MEQSTRYIGFDIGAESGRCVMGELKQDRIELTEVHRFWTPSIHYAGHIHWDILAIYQELEKGLSLASDRFGSRFEGISIDTWGVDYVLLDADDRLLGYPYHYRDGRTDGLIEEAFRIVPKEKIYQQTGSQFVQYNTLFQLLAEKKQKLNLLELANQMLPVPNFLLFLLSGVKTGEYTIVSTTNLADPGKREWAWDLIDSFGLPRKIFPEVVEPGTQLGTLIPELARKTSISEDTPVIAGASHDTAAAVASVPAEGERWAYLSSGTWSLMGVELTEPLIDKHAFNYNFTNEGGVENTIRFLKNIIGLWPVQECRRDWAEMGNKYEYSELAKLALENGPANAWINLNDSRFLKAGQMPGKIISFLKETNQSFQEDAGWIIRCVLESLAFKYRTTMKELETVTGQSLARLHAVGGGIQNEILNQLTADSINREVVAGPVEGTIAGNIGVQAISTGAVANNHELRKIVANSFDLKTYRPQQPEYFDENEDLYCDILNRTE